MCIIVQGILHGGPNTYLVYGGNNDVCCNSVTARVRRLATRPECRMATRRAFSRRDTELRTVHHSDRGRPAECRRTCVHLSHVYSHFDTTHRLPLSPGKTGRNADLPVLHVAHKYLLVDIFFVKYGKQTPPT